MLSPRTTITAQKVQSTDRAVPVVVQEVATASLYDPALPSTHLVSILLFTHSKEVVTNAIYSDLYCLVLSQHLPICLSAFLA